MSELKIALAQLNPVVGDLSGNADRIIAVWEQARDADLIVGSELLLTGYPPEDLVVKPYFLDRVDVALERLVQHSAQARPGLIVGLPWRDDRGRVFNAAALIDGGEIIAVRSKHHLPNYRVFDEMRIFAAGGLPEPVDFRGIRLGLMVCEDSWHVDVARALAEQGAELLVVPNASPFEEDKPSERLTQIAARVSETGLPAIYVNQVGGQDDLIFDGGSFVLNRDAEIVFQGRFFEPDIGSVSFEKSGGFWSAKTQSVPAAPPERLTAMYGAAMLGLRDYVDKNGASGVILGLSGGIDSALVAAMATDALGPARVTAVMMPSPYTSTESLEDAAETARLLGIAYETIGIQPAMAAFEAMLNPLIGNRPKDVTEENIQSRARGLTLMALSNKLGAMVLSTGNKSELAVGYATLYGDMCGAYNPVKDIYKTDVFRLAEWRNAVVPPGGQGPGGQVIPTRVITRPPTAELRPDQKDEDSLPPYVVLDDILQCLIEHDMATEDIIARGHQRDTVNTVWRLLDRAEYKRFQAPPGPKVSRRAFGKERRYPLTNLFLAGL